MKITVFTMNGTHLGESIIDDGDDLKQIIKDHLEENNTVVLHPDYQEIVDIVQVDR